MITYERKGTIRVRAPEGWEVVDVPPPAEPARLRRASLPRGPISLAPSQTPGAESTLVAAMQSQDMALLDRFDVVAGARVTRSSGQRSADLSVELDAQGDAALLLEHDGFYSWQAASAIEAVPAARRGALLTPARRRATFDIRLSPPGEATRGGGHEFVAGRVRAYLFTFIARVGVAGAISFLERNARDGLVHIRGVERDKWQPIDDVAALALPADRAPRLLLLLHGTFSTTFGSFGALAATKGGRAFLWGALKHYDAVVGWDHATLRKGPGENAAELLAALERGRFARPPVIDAIAYSRGGLVIRCLAERLLLASPLGARVDRAVFVAGTNGGTRLAAPENWGRLADLYTNLTVCASRVVEALAPTTAPAAEVLRESVKSFGALVKCVAAAATDARIAPGLAAMVPGSPFLKGLAGAPVPRAAPAPRYFVATSDFSAPLARELADGGLPRRLLDWLLDGAADALMLASNDLVVDTSSMSVFGEGSDGLIGDRLDFGPNPRVYHLAYFTQPEMAAALGRWLEVDPDDHPGMVDMGDHDGDGIKEHYRGKSATTRGAAPATPAAGREGAPTLFFAVSLPGQIPVNRWVPLEVLVSEDRIEVRAAGAFDVREAKVSLDQKVRVQIVPKVNVEVGEIDHHEFDPSEPPHLAFDVRGVSVGRGEIWVLVRQGPIVLAHLTLTPEVVAGEAASAKPVRVEAEALTAGPAAEGYPVLQIFEWRSGGIERFRFVLDLDAEYIMAESAPLKADRASYVAGLYKSIEQRWQGAGGDAKAFHQELRALGSILFDELVPVGIQAALWKVRDELRAIQIVSEEPFIPWELVHLQPPTPPGQPLPGGLPDEEHFLAQKGLVRWLHNRGRAPAVLANRADRSRYIIPDYPHPDYALPQAQQEIPFLQTSFGAQPVPPTRADVMELLRARGAFDLFHFSGHGETSAEGDGQGRIMMQGAPHGAHYVPEFLPADVVATHARLVAPDGARPLVVLNSCQNARAGWRLTGMGGFADAFLRTGAGCFVGSLWAIGDRPARLFSEAFYEALLAGEPLATAAMRGREAARAGGDATWLAYVVYGNPKAKLSAK